MSYFVSLRSRDAKDPITLERIRAAALQVSDRMVEAGTTKQVLHIRHGEVSFDIELIGGDWLVYRFCDASFELFVRIAGCADCDVEGVEKELYRWERGKVVMIHGPVAASPMSIWVRYPWLPVAIIICLLVSAFLFRVVFSI